MLLSRLGLTLILLVSPASYAAMKVVVSVDWEGRNLDPQNLAAMEHLRHDYPDIPLQHFLNAAYYTKPGADAAVTTAAMRSVLRQGDDLGLHIHTWRSLVQASGVTFRTEPAFRGPIDLKLCDPDCGHDVNMASYTEEELRKIVKFSIATLSAQGFPKPKTFRAGAWQADNRVFRALVSEGITLDSSATWAEFLKERWGKSLLYPVVGRIWPKTVRTSQPYRVDLGNGKSILELPNNGCLADYVDGDSMLATFQANAALWKTDPKQDIYVSIGFHQETAQKFLPHIRDGIEKIRAYASREKIPVEWVVPPLKGL